MSTCGGMKLLALAVHGEAVKSGRHEELTGSSAWAVFVIVGDDGFAAKTASTV